MPSRAYANSKIPVERSRAQIEKLLTGAGVRQIRTAVDISVGLLVIEFVWPLPDGMIPVRLKIDLDPDDEREQRRMMRVAFHWTKNRIEAVTSGFRTAQEEFLGEIVVKGGATVFDMVKEQLGNSTGSLRLLPQRANR